MIDIEATVKAVVQQVQALFPAVHVVHSCLQEHKHALFSRTPGTCTTFNIIMECKAEGLCM